jgi:integrase
MEQHMATITKQKGVKRTSYKVRIRKLNSPTVTKSFSSKNLAERWARKTELGIEEGTYFEKNEASKHTVAKLVDKYIDEELQKLAETDWRARKLQLKWWKSEIGHLTLNKVTPIILVECRNKLSEGVTTRKTKRSGSTVNRYIAALSAAYGIAASEWHWIAENPVLQIKKEKENPSRVRFLSADERNALIETCKESRNDALYLITLIALSTGMRQAEIMTIKWDQVDFDRRRITLFKTKNKEIRVVPIVGVAANQLKTYGKIRSIKNPFVFAGRNGTNALFPRKAWEDAIKDAKINDFHFHDCRHSAASELAMNGASLHEIAAVLGHKTLAMVQRYAHLSEQHTMSVVERMNTAVFGDME